LINFVSNLPHQLRSGGFSAMNAAAYEALRGLDDIHYVGPIDPPMLFREKAASRLMRTLGLQGSFFAFSNNRLERIAREVCERRSGTARFEFFHGFTPWILTRPSCPYAAWSDCTFHDYIDVYHQRDLFQPADLARIEYAEAAWLRGAHCVGFSSRWAARRAMSHYALDPSRVDVVGNFGEIDVPVDDEYAGGKQFTFVSTDFDAKGGPTVLSAFFQLRRRHPDARLVVVGAKPRGRVKETGVAVAGFLRKEVPEEYAAFRKILGATRALVHPTNSDISPLIIIEAGLFGCPAIASNRFAIPELVDHGASGILLDEVSPSAVADAMIWMLENEVQYRQMRRQARAKTASQYSKTAFDQRMQALVAPLMVQ
jgi:glycosyltransferase involved in cell wall biosynthesis